MFRVVCVMVLCSMYFGCEADDGSEISCTIDLPAYEAMMAEQVTAEAVACTSDEERHKALPEDPGCLLRLTTFKFANVSSSTSIVGSGQ